MKRRMMQNSYKPVTGYEKGLEVRARRIQLLATARARYRSLKTQFRLQASLLSTFSRSALPVFLIISVLVLSGISVMPATYYEKLKQEMKPVYVYHLTYPWDGDYYGNDDAPNEVMYQVTRWNKTELGKIELVYYTANNTLNVEASNIRTLTIHSRALFMDECRKVFGFYWTQDTNYYKRYFIEKGVLHVNLIAAQTIETLTFRDVPVPVEVRVNGAPFTDYTWFGNSFSATVQKAYTDIDIWFTKPQIPGRTPVACIEVSATHTRPNIALVFDGANSDDPDGYIQKYFWDFGDGTWAEGMITSHAFSQDGNYTVTLYVKDNTGLYNSTSVQIVVESVRPEIIELAPKGRNVSVRSNISVLFSEPMNITATARALSTTPAINGTIVWSQNNTRLTLVPSETLKYNTNYKVFVSEEAMDLAGNRLPALVGWRFTTEARPPLIMSYVSGDNQSALVGTTLRPFVVRLATITGINVSGIMVAWRIVAVPPNAAGYYLTANSSVTDAQGLASTSLHLGNLTGRYTVSASAEGLVIFFNATATRNQLPNARFSFSLGPEAAYEKRVNVSMTITGTKWRTLELEIRTADGFPVGSVSATRVPGAPVTVSMEFKYRKDVVYYIWLKHTSTAIGETGVWLSVALSGLPQFSARTHLVLNADAGRTQSVTLGVTVNDLLSSALERVAEFNATASSDPDGTITNYTWRFGDRMAGYGSVVWHRYEDYGSYQVSLAVCDDRNGSSSTTFTVDIIRQFTPPGPKQTLLEMEPYAHDEVGVILDPATVLIYREEDGLQIGYLRGKFINQIPGAIVELYFQNETQIYRLPKGYVYRTAVSGTGSYNLTFVSFGLITCASTFTTTASIEKDDYRFKESQNYTERTISTATDKRYSLALAKVVSAEIRSEFYLRDMDIKNTETHIIGVVCRTLELGEVTFEIDTNKDGTVDASIRLRNNMTGDEVRAELIPKPAPFPLFYIYLLITAVCILIAILVLYWKRAEIAARLPRRRVPAVPKVEKKVVPVAKPTLEEELVKLVERKKVPTKEELVKPRVEREVVPLEVPKEVPSVELSAELIGLKELLDAPGIGINELSILRAAGYKDIKMMLNLREAQLAAIPGLSKEAAHDIYLFLRLKMLEQLAKELGTKK